MRRLSWFVLSIAMLTLIILPLMTRTNILAEEEKKAAAEEREWGEEVNGCRVSIQLKDYDDKEYGPVILSVIAKNTGKGVVSYSAKVPDEDYKVTVKDEKGNEVPLTRYGHRISISKNIFKRTTKRFDPGEQEENTIAASRIYDMTLPGTYSVSVHLSIQGPDREKRYLPTSNTTTVKVPE